MGFHAVASVFRHHPLRSYIFLFIVIGLFLVSPARADVTLGALKGQPCLPTSNQQAERFAGWLEQQLGEPVRLRIFNSPTLLHQWMNRYREVDLGLLPADFLDQYHAIEFQRLIAYEPTRSSIKTTILAGRRGLPGARIQQLRDLLLTMDTDAEGIALLKEMGVGAYRAPGSDRVVLQVPSRKTKPARIVRRREAKPPAPPKAVPVAAAPAAVPKPRPIQTARVTEKAPSLNPVKTVVQPTPSTRPTEKAPAPPEEKPAQVSVAKSEPTIDKTKETGSPKEEKVAGAKKSTGSQTEGPDRRHYTRQESPRKQVDQRSFSGRGKHYLLLIAAILALGGLLKFVLILQRRPRRKPSAAKAHVVMQHDWSELNQSPPVEKSRHEPQSDPAPEPAFEPAFEPVAASPSTEGTETPATKAPAETERAPGPDSLTALLQPPVQVPTVLARIDREKISGTLRVTAAHNEKILCFIRGQLVSASSQNIDTRAQAGFLMNKLGYLLVRQGKITEEDRDRALVLCEGNPSMRLGEALVELGALKRPELMRSLQDQAKMILHSLIVFPEGDFHFEPGTPVVAVEDNLRLPVSEFLREASAHEHEWDNIRSVIPSLDTILEFAPGGRDKVNSGRLTVHQKFVLSLIDGQRCIRDICTAATMLDYELYRFLYLMVKANILKRADQADSSPAARLG
ncbi:MAG: hypothetical protein Tsb0017_01880 [Geothermobacteraceae bacterium]